MTLLLKAQSDTESQEILGLLLPDYLQSLYFMCYNTIFKH